MRGAGAYRHLIGVKVSDQMAAQIDQARAGEPRTEFIRRVLAAHFAAAEHGRPLPVDWERRARRAESLLATIRQVIGGGRT